MSFQYDIVVVGAGPGGYQTAVDASLLGYKVLVVEKSDLGGVCLNVGCIPTKALLKSAKIYNQVLESVNYGVSFANNSGVSLNWEKMQQKKLDVVKKLVGGIGYLFKANKVELKKGFAQLLDPNTVEVNGEKVTAKYIILATGSSARMLPVKGFEEGFARGHVLTSTEALSLKEVPKTMTVIGGGVIGMEFASLYAELGTQVTVIQGVDRILEMLDKEVSATMAKLCQDVLKMKIVPNAKVLELKADDTLVYELDGKQQTIKSDKLLISVGRKVNHAGLEKLDFKKDDRGLIVVNDYMQTSFENIFLIGDAVGKVMLAHVAYKHGAIVLDYLLNKKTKINYNNVPSCIYTYPEVGCIGQTEEQLIAQKVEYYKHKIPMAAIGKALLDENFSYGFCKLLVGKKYGEILGCHIVASTASDMIAELAVAMEAELVVEDIARAVHPHPTIAEAIGECAKHIYFKHFAK